MIDFDIYHTNHVVESFLESLKVKLNKDYTAIKVYISTANSNNNWLENLYNSTKLMEVCNETSI